MAEFSIFRPTTPADIIRHVTRLPTKHCQLDRAPTHLVKEAILLLAPVISTIVNRSLQESYVPVVQKTAIIIPRLKKSHLDPKEPCNYRPISNLSFLSKVIEWTVLEQFLCHLTEAALIPDRQSAYLAHCSTETALLRVHTDICTSLDNGDCTLLALLDLSAAFDIPWIIRYCWLDLNSHVE